MAAQQPIYSPQGEQQLMTELWDPNLANDLYRFVMYAYPWGKEGTPLANHKAPRGWQRETLDELTLHIKRNELRYAQRALYEMWRSADASGRGIGKSAMVSWLVHWFQTTRLGASTIVTANTEYQLKSKTWAELGKWVALAINSHWWEMTALSLRPADWFGDAIKRDLKIDTGYYYAQAQLWSEEKPDAFAGLHNHNGIMLIMDEASGIPDNIWGVSEGFFTEPVLDRYWFVFSNPRRNVGSFYDCFHKNRNFWKTRRIDARTVEGTDPSTYQRIIEQDGEDSYNARVEVKGEFPNSSLDQLIPVNRIEAAEERAPTVDMGAPLVMGCDVARSGNCRSVIAFRQGRDAVSIPWQIYTGEDTAVFMQMVAHAADKYKVDAILMDGNGVGGPLCDILKSWGYKIIDVQAGGSAREDHIYGNKRAEIWGTLAEWLLIGSIPKDSYLKDDLISAEKKIHPVNGKLYLKSKEDMRSSPDYGDALALTFGAPIARKDVGFSRKRSRMMHVAKGTDHPIFGQRQ